jgi:hypothetical protein
MSHLITATNLYHHCAERLGANNETSTGTTFERIRQTHPGGMLLPVAAKPSSEVTEPQSHGLRRTGCKRPRCFAFTTRSRTPISTGSAWKCVLRSATDFRNDRLDRRCRGAGTATRETLIFLKNIVEAASDFVGVELPGRSPLPGASTAEVLREPDLHRTRRSPADDVGYLLRMSEDLG